MLKENEDFSTIMIEGEEFVRYPNTTYVEREDVLGYIAEGFPTDAQIDFQDELDSLTDDFLASIYELLDSNQLLKTKDSKINLKDIPYHDMELNMNIYNVIMSKFNLEDFY